MIRISGRTRVLSLVLATTLAGFGATGVGQAAHASPTTAAGHLRPSMTHAQAAAALSRAELLFRGTRAQSRAVQEHEDATMVLRDLRAAYPHLTPAERTAADRILARPGTSADGSQDPVYAAGPVLEECDTDVCVHYVATTSDATNGVNASVDANANGFPDYVDSVLTTLDHVRAVYQSAGYRTPLSDSTSANDGGDGRFDVYLAELGNQGLYGYCTSDDPALGTASSAPTSYAGSAYCVLDNDYSSTEYPAHTPLENLDVTVAHEYFHAVQFSYDFFEDPWIMEATATWAEDQLYTGINDNMQYLLNGPNPISNPSQPIDINGDVSYHWYGTWIFFRFLTERLVTTGSGGLPLLVKQIWQKLDANTAANPSAPDQYSIQGVKSALASHGISLTTAVSRFDLAARHPTRFFREAAANHYPTAPVATSSTVGPGHLSWSTSFKLLHLSYRVLRLSPKAGTGSAWHLRLHLDLPATSRGAAATLWINKKSGGTSSRLIPLSSTGDATLSMAFNAASVKNIEVEVINASPRFAPSACWPATIGATYYSCYAAHSLDDNTAQYVKATAYRS